MSETKGEIESKGPLYRTPRDGECIGGMEVLVVPDWLFRRVSPSQVAVLLPHDVAASLRKQLEEAGVIEPLQTPSGEPTAGPFGPSVAAGKGE